MARIELNIVALGDFTSVNAQIKALQTQVATLNKSVAGVGLGAGLAKDLNAAQAAFHSTMLSTGQFTASTVRMTSETAKFGTALQAGKLKLSEYFNLITGKAGAAQASLRALSMEQIKLAESTVVADASRRGFATVYTPTTINAVTAATKLATMQQNLYNMSLRGASLAMVTWGKNTQWAGRQLMVGLSMPMVIFGAVAVKAFKDANIELTRLQRLYGVGLIAPTEAQISAISDKVMNLSKTIASNLGMAQKDTFATAADFAAIGRTGDDLVTATEQAMRLSKLGSVDQKQAFTGIMTLQNTFKVSTKDLADSVNFMAIMQKQTALNLTDITDSFPRIGPIVKQLGGSYKDTAVMMLSMKEAGVPAAQAANALKSAMASLISPTTAAKEMFGKFNINLTGIAESTKGNPVKMIQALQQALQGIEPLARAQLIEKLFGKFQFARVTAMLDNLGKAGSQTQLAFKLAAASAGEIKTLVDQEMKIATESPTAKWSRALEGFKTTIYPVGQKFLELGTLILNVANKIGKAFSHLPSGIKTVLGVLALGSMLAGPFIMLTGLLANFVGYLMKAFLGIRQLAKGSATFKQLLTPEIIASKNAAELFGSAVTKDVQAVDLLNQAILKLSTSLSEMNGAMSVSSGGVASIANSARMMSAGSMLATTPMMKDLNRVHMSSALVTMDVNQALAAAKKGSITINGQVVKLKESLIIEIEKLRTALQSGIISAEQAAKMQFKVLNRDVMSGPAVMNRALSKGKFIETQAYLNQSMFQGMLTPSAMIAKNMAGAKTPMSSVAQVELEQSYAALTKQVMISEKQFSAVNAQRVEETHAEVLKRLNAQLVEEAKAGDLLAKEKLAVVRSMIANQGIASNLAINAGSASTAAVLRSQAGMGFSDQKGSSSYRPAIQQGVSPYGNITRTPGIVARNREIASVYGQLEGAAEGDGIASGILSKKGKIAAAEKQALNNTEVAIQSGINIATVFTEAEITTLRRLQPALVEQAYLSELQIQEARDVIAQQHAAKRGMMNMKLGSGMMMGSMGLMMFGGQNQAAQLGGQSLMMGSMAAMMTKNPYVVAAATIAPIVVKGISHMIEIEKEHAAMAKAKFTESSDAVSFFGDNVVDTTHRMMQFQNISREATSASTMAIVEGMKYTNGEYDSFKKMLDNLPKENPLALVAKSIKEANNDSSAKNIAENFAQMQMAIHGISQQDADKLVQLLLALGGKNATGAGVGAVNQIQAIKATLRAMNPDTKEFSIFIGKLTDLAINTKSWETYKAIVDAIGQSAKTSKAYVAALGDALIAAGDYKGASNVGAMGAQGFTGPEINAILTAGSAGIGVNTSNKKAPEGYINLKPGDTKAFKELNDKLQASKDAQTNSTNALANAQDNLTKKTTDSLKPLEAQQKILEANLKTLQDAQKVRQQSTSFATSKEDLKNQILMAQATGDNLKAQLLQQELMSKSQDYGFQQEIDKAQGAVNTGAENIANLKANADANAAKISAQVKASGDQITKALPPIVDLGTGKRNSPTAVAGTQYTNKAGKVSLEKLIKDNKIAKGSYFNYGGQLYRANEGYDAILHSGTAATRISTSNSKSSKPLIAPELNPINPYPNSDSSTSKTKSTFDPSSKFTPNKPFVPAASPKSNSFWSTFTSLFSGGKPIAKFSSPSGSKATYTPGSAGTASSNAGGVTATTYLTVGSIQNASLEDFKKFMEQHDKDLIKKIKMGGSATKVGN